MDRIILASGSPRRQQLLAQVGIPCEVIVSGADENIDGPPDYQVRELALRKAQAVQKMIKSEVTKDVFGNNVQKPSFYDNAIIIAADTLVHIDDKILGKPTNPDDAFQMLKSLSGCTHTVYTGVALIKSGEAMSFIDTAKVHFRNLTDDEILAYIATGEPFDKAGSYGVQDRGALLVDRIEGDYFTIVGLPVAKVAVALRDMGYEVWGK